ncbi:MAG: ATP-binding cassette domain-containing protein, partial [Chloroflexi bacterium]|nr:ATP-binding cassette domain-containing protein [Chloroflexota bacterium]
VEGLDVKTSPRQVRSLLGVVPQEDNLDPDLTVLQNLLVYARYFDLAARLAQERAWESLELFQLQHKKDSPIDTLSGGMKRRLLIARALLHAPRVLILDEPTTGLDPQARHLVWQKLHLLKAQGTTMLLSTHNMDEAAFLCDRLVIMDQGRILVEGAPSELLERYGGSEVVEVHPTLGDHDRVLQHLYQLGVDFQDSGDSFYVYSQDGYALTQTLAVDGAHIVHRTANLEDVFLRLTGRALREE